MFTKNDDLAGESEQQRKPLENFQAGRLHWWECRGAMSNTWRGSNDPAYAGGHVFLTWAAETDTFSQQ